MIFMKMRKSDLKHMTVLRQSIAPVLNKAKLPLFILLIVRHWKQWPKEKPQSRGLSFLFHKRITFDRYLVVVN